jgi:hypothetical protein
MTEPLRVLIACEFTGTVRREFDKLGHDVWSCDTRPAEDRSNRHITGDVREILDWGWDLLIVAHPPCTRLCNSGVRWLFDPPGKLGSDYTQDERDAFALMDRDARLAFMWHKLDEGAALFSDLWNAPVKRVAVENPVMHAHAKERIRGYQDFAQSIQPWQFGDFERKRTCFWLRGLPPLKGSYSSEAECAAALGLDGRPVNRVHSLGSSNADRSKERSRFFPSVAKAMAEQWGGFALGCAEIAA